MPRMFVAVRKWDVFDLVDRVQNFRKVPQLLVSLTDHEHALAEKDSEIAYTKNERDTYKQTIEAQSRELARLQIVCGEAYHAVGSLSSDVGAFEHEATQKALDNLSAAVKARPLPHNTFLPFPSFATRRHGLAAGER